VTEVKNILNEFRLLKREESKLKNLETMGNINREKERINYFIDNVV
jgi:hypothetical protein